MDKKKQKWEPRVKVIEYPEGEMASEMKLVPSPIWRHILLHKFKILSILAFMTLVWIVLVPISLQDFSPDISRLIIYLAALSYPLVLVGWIVGTYYFINSNQKFSVSVCRDGAVYLDRHKKTEIRIYNTSGSDLVRMSASINKDLTADLTLTYQYVKDYERTFYDIQKCDVVTLAEYMIQYRISKGYSVSEENQLSREFERL
jgi:hypothetical protein